jgi:hypothetical protein
MILKSHLAGFVAIVIAGIFNGSFAVPSKRIVSWKWEHVWFVFCLWFMGFLPLGVALLLAPKILVQISGDGFYDALKVSAFGVAFGFGVLLFGVSLPKVGMTIVNALVNAIVALLGSVSPLLIGSVQINRRGAISLATGLLTLLASIVLCASASVSRDRDRQVRSGGLGTRAQSLAGVAIACASGILSSMLNTGFASGTALIEGARNLGYSPALATLAIWVPVLLGGLAVNLACTAFLICRGRNWNLFLTVEDRTGCWVRSFFMGFLQFGGIFIYGFGVSVLGVSGTVYGWAGLVVISILTSNFWGAMTGEWKGSGAEAKIKMSVSTILLILAFAILSAHGAAS